MKKADEIPSRPETLVTLFLCGDVMTGRGIDQILPFPCDPAIHESYMQSALGYVELAEVVHGRIPAPVDFRYIWGDALDILDSMAPDARIINLETAVTVRDDYWRGKGINYRMNPKNVPCLTKARIDCCSLANNHVLDWGYAGLLDTIETLQAAGIQTAGAGPGLSEAAEPAIVGAPGKARVLVFSFGTETSGIPPEWQAAPGRPGVNLLPDLSGETVQAIGEQVSRVRQPGDIVVASIHWGGNWGYTIPLAHREFARNLIDRAGVDIIHGHSSHHVLGIEVYRHKLILYGCGDFLNDYEGIGGYGRYRGDIGLMYFPSIDPSQGRLVQMRMFPTQIHRFRVRRASHTDALWLQNVLNRESILRGASISIDENDVLTLSCNAGE